MDESTIKYIIARVIDNASDDEPKDRSEFTLGRGLPIMKSWIQSRMN